jgi:cytochrome c peroxidase
VSLGRSLFFEKRLSTSGATSCASCHLPDRAFADDRRFSVGDRGRETVRNSPSLLDRPAVGYQFWDGRAETLVQQVFGPLEDPDEMSVSIEAAVVRLKALPEYRLQFYEVFGGGISTERLARSIAAFVETLHAGPSDYEVAKAQGILSARVVRGEALFRGKGKCDVCHSGRRFTDERFHNTGISWKGGHDLGRGKLSGRSEDTRAFKTPSLLELVRTAPYMHDGSLATLEAVVEHYASGGAPEDGFQDPVIAPIDLGAAEHEDLVAFLRALSGTTSSLERPDGSDAVGNHDPR